MTDFVYDPCGVIEVEAIPMAARPTSTEGLRLGVLSNTKWNAAKLLRATVRELADDGLTFASVTCYDKHHFSSDASPELISQIAAEMLPWTWLAFSFAAIAGLLMFSSKALIYSGNIPFRLKMCCLLLAGINMMLFHWLGTRHLDSWDKVRPPRSAKLAGGASLLLWTVIVAAGRWIGFTT